jgi:hypothetical protein
MTTQAQVEQSRQIYQHLLEQFLLERGWVCSDDEWDTWSKLGTIYHRSLLTTEEAYWSEAMVDEDKE